MDTKQMVLQLRQVAAALEKLERAAPKGKPTAEKLAGEVANLMAGGFSLEMALLPVRLRYGDDGLFGEVVEQVRAAVRDVRAVGEELEREN